MSSPSALNRGLRACAKRLELRTSTNRILQRSSTSVRSRTELVSGREDRMGRRNLVIRNAGDAAHLNGIEPVSTVDNTSCCLQLCRNAARPQSSASDARPKYWLPGFSPPLGANVALRGNPTTMLCPPLHPSAALPATPCGLWSMRSGALREGGSITRACTES